MIQATYRDYSIILPTIWSEVSLKQFAKLYPKRTVDEQGVETYDKFIAARCMVNNESNFDKFPAGDIQQLVEGEWLPRLGSVPDWLSLPIPGSIGGIVPPDYVGSCTHYQVDAVRELVRERLEEESPADYISLAIPTLSIFLYPKLTGRPLENTSQLSEIEALIEALPVTEALPLSAFFLSNYQTMKPSGKMSFVISSPNPPPKPWLIRWFQNWRTTRIISRLQRLLRRSA